MDLETHVRNLLHEEADQMHMPTGMPSSIRRTARVRSLKYLVAAGSLAILIATAVIVLPGPERSALPPVGGGGSILGSGKVGARAWALLFDEKDQCLRVKVDDDAFAGLDICHEFGESWRENIFVRSVGEGDSYIVGRVPSGSDVLIELEGGGTFVTPIFKAGDNHDFFARFFEDDVKGLLTITRRNGHELQARFYNGRQEGVSGSNGVRFAPQGRMERPGFEGLEGDLHTLSTGTGPEPGSNDFYDLVLRVSDDEVCLHLEGATSCRAGDTAPPIRLVVGVADAESGLVGGEVGNEVAEAYVEVGGDRYPAQLLDVPPSAPPGIGRYFLTTPYPSERTVDVVALDEEGNEIHRVALELEPPS